jgi:hypothetical protein
LELFDWSKSCWLVVEGTAAPRAAEEVVTRNSRRVGLSAGDNEALHEMCVWWDTILLPPYAASGHGQFARPPHLLLPNFRLMTSRTATRCFEKALEAYFCGEDCGVTLYREWGAYRDASFEYKKGETWDRILHHGVQLSVIRPTGFKGNLPLLSS